MEIKSMVLRTMKIRKENWILFIEDGNQIHGTLNNEDKKRVEQ